MSELDGTLLLADDDETFRIRLARAFRERGYDVVEAADVEQALAISNDHPVTRAVVDLRLGASSGLDLVQALVRHHPDARVVVLTGYGSIATALEAVRLGADHYLTKPATVEDILAGFERGMADATPETPAGDAEVPSLARVEWEHINRVLADCGGNISEAARRLGIHRRSLQRKLAKYPVKR